MLPVVISEQLVHFFKFYLNSQVKQGMRHGNDLYQFIDEFDRTDRLQAYQKACTLAEQGIPVVVTASSLKYAIWSNLKSLSELQHRLTSNSPVYEG